MPGGDKTGPAGMGPMTGRAAGLCAGYGVPGYMNPISGRGYGGWNRGSRGGRGWRHWFNATGLPRWVRRGGHGGQYARSAVPFAPAIIPEEEIAILRGQAEQLEDTLNGIKKRVGELESQTSSKETTE